jgi:translation initiation factor 3 subunit F
MNTSASSTSTSSQPVSDLEIIERSLLSVSDMLERVLTYVRAVLSGEKTGDPAIGRYLMDTLGASTDDLEKGGFNASLQVRVQILTLKYTHHCALFTQDTLMISYLANLVRSQAEVSSRLALTATS